MTEYSDLISNSFGRSNPALPQVVGNIDEDPDRAQRALDLAKATGVPGTAIYGDLDEFERQHKAVAASDIVANNPHLADFVQSNPLVPKIANDDYGTLDAVSEGVHKLRLGLRAGELSRLLISDDPLKRWKEGGPLGSWLRTEDTQNHPFASSVAATLATPIELLFRGIGGAIETTADVATQAGGRDVGALVEAEAMGLTGRGHPLEPYERARPYVQNNREPLPTVLPEYDTFRAKQNIDDLTALKEVTSEAQQSTLRDRNPDLFRDFIASHTDAEISVGGDAVAALYGDKLPHPDDGVLGWVPGITDKLALARATGTDVSIPLADWLAKAEPDLIQTLHDDIRVRPGGITARESALAAESEPQGSLTEVTPQIRAASALEPLFSIGDRKLELQRMQQDAGTKFGVAQGFHDFNMVDEKGNTIGALNISEQKGGKQLYVDNITGVNGLGSRDFGPSLMRDLLRQIKQEFPNAESISGHRVSGARERAGKEMTMPEAVVKLDNPDIEAFGRVLEGGKWEQYAPNISAYVKPYAERSVEDRRLIDIVTQELDRIAPQKLQVQEADRIEASGVEGQLEGSAISPTGAYIPYKEAYPILLYSLEEGNNPLGTARHEAIHHLRNYGFFHENEWSTLIKASTDNDWQTQFKIRERYPDAMPALRFEEAIADAYKEWEAGRFEALPEVQTIFKKMKAFFEAIKKRIGELLGKEPTWEDIFQKVSTGEVGSREGKPLDPRAFDEKLSVPEDPEGGSRIFERASALGMTVDQFKRYDELMAKRHAEDIESATERARDEQAREQTKQWKEDRKALRVEIASDIRQRPDVAADLFFGSGELYGKKVPMASIRLDEAALTSEQKATLPSNYYGKSGLHPDDVAGLFGYGSGDVLVERLGQYSQARQAAGMSAKDFVSRVIDMETDRQMQIKHGDLEHNIVDAVKEQVSGETQQNLLAEETLALGIKSGAAPLDKATIMAQLRDQFAKMPLASVSSDAYLRAAGQSGRMAEMALLNNDPAAAFIAKQQQWYATVIANEASKLERDINKFETTAKRFSKREVPSVDQEYTNFIHDILLKVGRPIRRSIQDLEGEIGAGEYKTLQDFVEGKNGFYLREVAVADMLFDSGFRKKFEDLTVDEFRAVDTSIKSMVKNGRDEKKITKAGVEADLADIKGQMIEALKRFDEKEYNAKGERAMGLIPGDKAAYLRTFGIDHLQLETVFNRWDAADPKGVFQQYVLRDIITAVNSESAKRKVYAARLRELDDDADLKKMVDNPLFKVPGTEQLMKFTRANLRTILLNAGNTSNLDKLARGYKLKPEQVLQWIDHHATKEDWDWAQKMGDVFADLKKEADVMYRNISGVAPESIRLDPVTTPHGQYPGWYYPLIAHPEFEGGVKKMMGKDALEQEGFVRATTANGYTKARTGVAYPLALDLDMLPNRIGQMIHDIELRPAIINASKIFYDKDVRSTIFSHFGAEWRDMLIPYLRDIANAANYTSKSQARMTRISEFFRQNMITTLVGLNPGTFMKHTPTALVQSIQEVGKDRFLEAVRKLYSTNELTSETNWNFAMRESEELQRRHSHFIETLGGAADELIPTSGFAKARATVNYWAALPVAKGDLWSAVPTWLAQYAKEMEEGSTHGDAVYMADRAVRRAHGSTAISNRPAVMRGGYNPWLASVYGFFNHIMNRQYEMTWKAGETLDMIKNKEGTYVDAMKEGKALTDQLWAYVIAPAIIEELVSPQITDDHESWGIKAAKALAFTLSSSWIGVRDVANGLLNGKDPSVGLASSALKTLTDVGRDLSKDKPLSKEHAGKLIKDASTLLGAATGLMPSQVGKVFEFGYGVSQGTERPKGPWGWMTGARYGTLYKHPGTFQEWQRHHIGIR